MHYVAVVQYDGFDPFYYSSHAFSAESISMAWDNAQKIVDERWRTISPHNPPKVIDLIVGVMRIYDDSE